MWTWWAYQGEHLSQAMSEQWSRIKYDVITFFSATEAASVRKGTGKTEHMGAFCDFEKRLKAVCYQSAFKKIKKLWYSVECETSLLLDTLKFWLIFSSLQTSLWTLCTHLIWLFCRQKEEQLARRCKWKKKKSICLVLKR